MLTTDKSVHLHFNVTS